MVAGVERSIKENSKAVDLGAHEEKILYERVMAALREHRGTGEVIVPTLPDPLELPPVETYLWNRIRPDDPEESETTQTNNTFRSAGESSGCSHSQVPGTDYLWLILALLALRATNSSSRRNDCQG